MKNRHRIPIYQAIDIFGNRYELGDEGITSMSYYEGDEGTSDYIVVDFENNKSAVIWSFASFVTETSSIRNLLGESYEL